MKIFTEKRGWFLTAVFTMLMAIALPATAFGHDHGRRERPSHRDRKCAKFVNCHDARDGLRNARRLRRGGLVLDDNGRLVRRDRDRDLDRDRDSDDNNSLRNGRIRERERDRDSDNDSRRNRRGKRHDDDDHNQ